MIPDLGKKDDRETTPTILIDDWYRKLGHAEWDNERFNRLCRLWHVTPYEMGKLFCIPLAQMKHWQTLNRFPAYVSLHFRMLESFTTELITKQPQQPIVPLHILQP